jgi:glycosyltransferase involved in cell wall biosynthesis
LNEKIRVLTIHNRLHLGGPIFIVAYLTKYLPADIYETKLVMGPPLPDEISADFFLEKENVPFILVKEMIRSVDPLNDIKAFIKIRKIIKEFKPHIVHTHTAKAGTLGRLAAWSCGVPVTFHTFHGHVFHSYFSAPVNFGIKLFERTLARFTSRIVTISEKQKLEICGEFNIVSPDRCPVIPLGFDLDKFRENPEERRTTFREKYSLQDDEVAIGIIGRFAPIKNHMLLFRAIKLLKHQQPGLYSKLVIFCVGDGELKSEFQSFLDTENIQYSEIERKFSGGGVIFTSWVRQVEIIMPGFDLVVLTSDNEGTPLSLIEAQAAGVAVLSTEVGGVEDVVNKGETGWLVPKNDPQALMETITLALSNKQTLAEKGKNGRDWVLQKFSYQRLVDDTHEHYQRILQQKSLKKHFSVPDSGKKPRVSIITVCKNRLDLLKDTIKSVAIQDYENIEYIIVDASSTDGTVDYISTHPSVNKYLSEPDEGIYDAMNKGLSMATGDIIAFLNSDDKYVNPNVISTVVETFIKKQSQAVYGDIIYVSENKAGKIKRYWKSGNYRINSFQKGWMPPHPAFFVQKKIFDKYGNFNSSLSLAGDYELMLRFIHFHGIFVDYLPKILVSMRSGGASNQSLNNRLTANKQDRQAWEVNNLEPYFFTIWLKPFRKLPQWLLPGWRVPNTNF